MITIVDYGLGNVQAFVNVYRRLNIAVKTATSAAELTDASKVILPGVGCFDQAMEQLERSGMRATLDELVLRQHVPVLGVCVGMQMLGQGSDEGTLPGLGWIDGRVKALECLMSADRLPVPHMGWNKVRPSGSNRLFAQLNASAQFYFLHSYYFQCDHEEDVIAMASYGTAFPCAVNAANIFGVQFHPEKSHQYGTRLLKNFGEM